MSPYQSQKITRNKNTRFRVSSEANFTGILFDISHTWQKEYWLLMTIPASRIFLRLSLNQQAITQEPSVVFPFPRTGALQWPQ